MRSLWLQLVWNQVQVAPTKVYLIFLHIRSVLLHYCLVSWLNLVCNVSDYPSYKKLHSTLPAAVLAALKTWVCTGEPKAIQELWDRRDKMFLAIDFEWSERNQKSCLEWGYAAVRCGHLEACICFFLLWESLGKLIEGDVFFFQDWSLAAESGYQLSVHLCVWFFWTEGVLMVHFGYQERTLYRCWIHG